MASSVVFPIRLISVEMEADFTVCHDVKWTAEAIGNILDNAVKYSFENSTVRVFIEEYGLYVSISVKNEGIGISEKESSRIFERFYRADKSRSKASGGTGLGLAIVKHIVLQLQARLQLQSQEGQGTSIQIYFPAKP